MPIAQFKLLPYKSWSTYFAKLIIASEICKYKIMAQKRELI